MDEYPKFLGHTDEDGTMGYPAWEDEPGVYSIEDPNDPGTTYTKPKLWQKPDLYLY